MRRFTPRSLICDTTETDRSTGEHSQKLRIFSTYLTTLRWIFVVLKIEEREVNLRVFLQLFCIHYFVVLSITKYLIGPEVLPRKFLSCAGVVWIISSFAGVVWIISPFFGGILNNFSKTGVSCKLWGPRGVSWIITVLIYMVPPALNQGLA